VISDDAAGEHRIEACSVQLRDLPPRQHVASPGD
jgi:hypothetical protein